MDGGEDGPFFISETCSFDAQVLACGDASADNVVLLQPGTYYVVFERAGGGAGQLEATLQVE